MKRTAHLRGFRITRHAAEQYIQRFAGNITLEEATKRLLKMSRAARRRAPAPGGATYYRIGHAELVVKDQAILTVYRVDTKPQAYAIEA